MTPTHAQPRNRARATRARGPCRRRGIAVPMVLCVVAVAAVLAYAMVTAAATRSAMARNATLNAQLELLAESGLNYVTHFIRTPDDAGPSGWFQPDKLVTTAVNSTWPAGGGTFTVGGGTALPGSFDYRVTWLGTVATDRTLSDFLVTSIGRTGADSRTLTATVRRRTSFIPQAAMTSRNAVKLLAGAQLTGADAVTEIRSGVAPAFVSEPARRKPAYFGRLTLDLAGGIAVGDVWLKVPASGGMVYGLWVSKTPTYCTGSTGTLISGATTIPLVENMPVNSSGSAAAATRRYYASGTAYTAALLDDGNGNKVVTSAGDLPVDLVNNPGRVYYCPGDLTLRTPTSVYVGLPPDLTLTGTLIVQGTLYVGAPSEIAGVQKISLTPVAGYPAIICGQDVRLNGMAKSLTINGLVHVVRAFQATQATATPSVVKINGALMVENADANTFGSIPVTTLEVNHVPANVNVPSFSTASNQFVQNVAVLEVR